MLALDLGLGWSTKPKFVIKSAHWACPWHGCGLEFGAQPKFVDVGGLMAPQASHPHGPSPC